VLYDPAQFEPLIEESWNEASVRAAIGRIVADTDAAFDPDGLWPAHDWDGWEAPLPLTGLYVGAAGVLRALDRLRPYAESTLDLGATAERTAEGWTEPDFPRSIEMPPHGERALFAGEVGVLLVACLLGARESLQETLRERIRANVDHESEELFWGAPGTLVAAAALGSDDLAAETADALSARRDDDGLWTQRLYGNSVRSLGAPHGLVGNVRALLQVEHERNEALKRETAAILAREAIVEDGLATWPLRHGGGLEASDGEVKLQWCGGAPGMVIAAWDYLDEELLLAGAELVWRAGPHGDEKGHGICHGTAGNGFALLKAFARTGDELWLERARRFAVHALAQADRLAAANGRRRFSLFTGDPGTALFAASCLEADARYPVLDVL
jgi:hypothetical protein